MGRNGRGLDAEGGMPVRRAPAGAATGQRRPLLTAAWLLAALAASTAAAQGPEGTNVGGAETSAPAEAPARVEAPGQAGRPGPAPRNLIPTDPVKLFLAGGSLMWPILACSIVAVWVALERLVSLRTHRVIPRAFVERFIAHLEQAKLDPDAAIELCEENRSPVAQVFAHGVRKWGKPSVEVEQAIIDGGERQVAQLRGNLRILNGVSTVAPLLGLLGTVVGMIMCFNQLASDAGHSKAEQLAGGIAVALLTTAAGLMVAIPTMIVYMYLTGRVDRLVMEMDHHAQRVVNLISMEGLNSKPRAPRPAGAAGVSPKPKSPVASRTP